MPFFENFKLEMIDLPEVTLRVRYGGSGPALLLLHGHPRTHTTWYKVAPILADHFTVVCPDLRGFGKSSKPADFNEIEKSSKRAKARDCIALMSKLGFDKFNLAGHDRGSYTAFRTAMDYPKSVAKLALMDSIPILEALERCNSSFAKAWWHWFFYAQQDLPERAILADPIKWYAGTKEALGEENYEDYLSAITDPETIRGMLADYRAGIEIDHLHDLKDREAERKIRCATHIICSSKDDIKKLFPNIIHIWQSWCDKTITSGDIESGHHLAEEAPEKLSQSLIKFFCSPQK